MARSGCTPDEVSYSAVINALGKAGRAADALRVFERMMDAGWVPDPVTCATGEPLGLRNLGFSVHALHNKCILSYFRLVVYCGLCDVDHK